MTLNQPTPTELADFVRHEGAKKAGQLLGISESAVCRRLNRAGIWMRGRHPNHIADVGKMVVHFSNHEQRMKQSEGTFT